MPSPLENPRHEHFAQGIAKGLTADAAYREAGYKAHRGNAATLRANQSIKRRVAELVAAGAAQAEVDVARVLQELARIGFSDIRKLVTPDGRLRPLHDLDDDTAAAIASVEVVTRSLPVGPDEPPDVEYVHKIKTWDKVAALDKIARHLGMMVERKEHSGPEGGAIPLLAKVIVVPKRNPPQVAERPPASRGGP